MARTLSDRLGLQLWSDDEDTWDREDFDANFQEIDNQVAIDSQGPVLDMFTDGDPTIAGQWHYATDIGVVFRSDGTRWRAINGFVSAQGLVSDPADPTTTTAELNAAIEILSLGGGGVVYFPAGVYMLECIDPDDPAPWIKGGIRLVHGVNLVGAPGAVLRWAGGPGSVIATPHPTPTPVLITGDVERGDDTYTVASSATFTAGDTVIVRLGQEPADHPEAQWWTFATVEAIPDGTHLTLSRAAGVDVDVSTITDGDAPNNRSIRRVPASELVEGNTIEGFYIDCDDPAGQPMEFALNLRYCRGVAVRDLTFKDPGAGITTYYSDGVSFTNVNMLRSRVPTGGHAGYGRGFSLSSTKRARIDRCRIEGAEKSFIYAEFGTELVTDQVELANTFDGRDQEQPMLITGTKVIARHRAMKVTGAGTNLHVGDVGDPDTSTRYWDLDLSSSTQMLRVPWYAMDGTTRLRTVLAGAPVYVDLAPPRRTSVVWEVVPSSTITIPIPHGLIARLLVYVSDTTGITDSNFSTTHNGDPTLVPIDIDDDTTVEITIQDGGPEVNVGGTYGYANVAAGNSIKLITDATVPVGPNVDDRPYVVVTVELLDPITLGTDPHAGLARPAAVPYSDAGLVRTQSLRLLTPPGAGYTIGGTGNARDRTLSNYTTDPVADPGPKETILELNDVLAEMRVAYENLRVAHDDLRAFVLAQFDDLAALGITDT